MTEFEKNCYGMSEQDIIDQYIEPNKIFGRDDIMIAGILSDCQEMLPEDGETIYNSERIRKQLNIAKFILFTVFEKESV